MIDAFVHGVVDALVGFAHPVVDAVGILLDNFDTAVCGASVDDDVFKVSPGLINNALDGFAKTITVVEIDGYDGKFHLTRFSLIKNRFVICFMPWPNRYSPR